MRLLTHNFLQSTVKGTENGYPLQIEVERVELEDPPSEINRDLLLRLLPKLNYPALLQGAEQIAPHVPGLPTLPKELPPYFLSLSGPPAPPNNNSDSDSNTAAAAAATFSQPASDEKDPETEVVEEAATTRLENESEDNLQTLEANLHKILFDVHLIDGALICPGTGRRFPVKDAIPNMLLHADEI
ncbi:hypothetical protein ACA910_007824 [Epithemia clementina (nom. ined.)]